MPSPWGQNRGRGAGPTPFTSQWINDPPEPPRPGRFGPASLQPSLTGPSWLPSERVMTALLVLVLVCATVLVGKPSDDKLRIAASSDAPPPADLAQGVGGVTQETKPAAASADESGTTGDTPAEAASDAPGNDQADREPTAASTPASLNLGQPASPPADGSILPYYRVVAYYGQPHDANMGILGEYATEDDLEGLHAALAEQAAEFELADPTRPIKLAFEVIATVAQGDPMSDGSWLLSTDHPTIQMFIDYAAANDMLVILDVQIGRRGVPDELELIRRYLEYPHVQVALDPEFAMRDGQVPGIDIGQIDAADVRYAQEYLAALTAELGLPPKILIVHQFHYAMIENKDEIAPYPGVQLVLDSDGWGPPELKRETYAVTNTQQPIEFNGIKLFYRQDEPLMTPSELIALDPVPDLIIYQ